MDKSLKNISIPLLSGTILFFISIFFIKFLIAGATIFFLTYFLLRFVILKENMKLDTPKSTFLTLTFVIIKILNSGLRFLLDILNFTKITLLFILKNRQEIKNEVEIANSLRKR